MSKRVKKKPVRPIGTRRDYEGASAVAKRLSRENPRDSQAELRLQSLLRELDKYDETAEEDESEDGQAGYDASGPRRRWSDDEQS